MAGFAVVVDPSGIPGRDDEDARAFFAAVGECGALGAPASVVDAPIALAARYVSPTSRPHDPTDDPATGSWALACGTLVDPAAPPGDSGLAALAAAVGRGEALSALAATDGLFGVVAWDAPRRRIVVATDRLGHQSIFRATRNGRTYLATSALGLARHLGADLDTLGARTFLLTGRVVGDATIWSGIRRFGAAEAWVADADGSTSRPYWRLEPEPGVARQGLDAAVESSVALAIDVLCRNVAGEGEVWCDLTGGFDSRFVAMLLERAGVPFILDTVGPDASADVRIAAEIARRTGWPHVRFELPATWPDELATQIPRAVRMGDAHVNVVPLSRTLWVHEQEARTGRSLLLNGMGGEMWRAPIWWPEGRSVPRSSVVHYDRQLWSLMHPVPRGVLLEDSDQDVRDDLVERFRAHCEQSPDEPATLKLDRLWMFRETGHAGAWSTAPAGILRTLPVLFSPDLVRHLVSFDPGLRLRNALVRHAFSRYRPVLADIDVEGRGPAGPLRLRTAHRHVAARLAVARRAADKALEVAGRRSGSAAKGSGLPSGAVRAAVFDRFADSLDPRRMRSAPLYRLPELERFLAAARTQGFASDEFLGRVLTIELAMREADDSPV